MCDISLAKGGLRNVTICDKDEGGVKKSLDSCDVIYRWPLMRKSNIDLKQEIHVILKSKHFCVLDLSLRI